MGARVYVNNYASTISTGITDSDTTIVVTSATGLPTLSGSDYYYLTLDNLLGTVEIVKVTARTGTSLTVVRAQESTTAVNWVALSTIEMRPTATSLTDVAGAAGKLLVSDGTRWTNSTPKYPYNAAATDNKCIVGNGTNYVEETVIQVVTANTAAVATGTTVIPYDDTIPQNTEGDQYLTASITPTNTAHYLVIDVIAHLSISAVGTPIIALFQDSTADALCATGQTVSSSNGVTTLRLQYVMVAGTTSSTTFNIRIGPASAATITFNGNATARRFGGVSLSRINIIEMIA